jgi:hypothetical protein
MHEEDVKKFYGMNFLRRIELGKQITDLLGEKHGSSFDFDVSIKESNLIEQIHSLFQSVMDHNDIWEFYEYGARSEVISHFQEFIDSLEKNDLWVFGGTTQQPHGNFDPSLILDVIVLRVFRKDNLGIIKMDLN